MSWTGNASGDARTASAVIRDSPLAPSPAAVGDRVARRPLEDLAEDPILDPGYPADLAERLVATKRIGDLADGAMTASTKPIRPDDVLRSNRSA